MRVHYKLFEEALDITLSSLVVDMSFDAQS